MRGGFVGGFEVVVVRRRLEIGSVAIVLVGVGPEAEATCW